MDRKQFFKRVGLGALALAVTPLAFADNSKKEYVKPTVTPINKEKELEYIVANCTLYYERKNIFYRDYKPTVSGVRVDNLKRGDVFFVSNGEYSAHGIMVGFQDDDLVIVASYPPKP